jgi:uncharacterized lipoprotein NlpE involved in copper resistance
MKKLVTALAAVIAVTFLVTGCTNDSDNTTLPAVEKNASYSEKLEAWNVPAPTDEAELDEGYSAGDPYTVVLTGTKADEEAARKWTADLQTAGFAVKTESEGAAPYTATLTKDQYVATVDTSTFNVYSVVLEAPIDLEEETGKPTPVEVEIESTEPAKE